MLAANDEQRRHARTKCERKAQVIEICERHISKDPGHVSRVRPLAVKDRPFTVVSRDPPDEPAREVKKNSECRAPHAELFGGAKGSVKIGQIKDGGEKIRGECQHHQRSIGYKMIATRADAPSGKSERPKNGEYRR